MSKTCQELLREAANLIYEALSRSPPAPAAQSQQIPAAPSHTPVPGSKATTSPRRRPVQVRSYTHMCCLAYHMAGNDNDPMVLTNKLMEVFLKLKEGGGSEFLKIAGSTCSQNLTLLPCPSTGSYLEDPSTMNGQAACTDKKTCTVST